MAASHKDVMLKVKKEKTCIVLTLSLYPMFKSSIFFHLCSSRPLSFSLFSFNERETQKEPKLS